ncbi:MAG: ROK family transcriptional regulator [Clostridia bacterium]|nr:ROK family transcriptional regulator [Clostridia bacterium]
MQKKINSEVMKSLNKNRIIRLIRELSCSRADLAKNTGLTKAAVSIICEELMERDLIVEGEKDTANPGRPATRLLLNGKYGCFGGIYISRSGFVAGICDFCGNVLAEERGEISGTDAKAIYSNIIFRLKDLVRTRNLLGVGVTAPGPQDRERGKLLKISNFSAWNDLDLISPLKESFDCPILLDNVSNALARAEFYKNEFCGKKYLELIIDDGFGSSLAEVADEIKLRECELGHTTVNMRGERCDCGNIGCAELYVNEKRFYSPDTADRDLFFDALAAVIANAVNGFSAEKVVFQGSVFKDFDGFAKTLTERLQGRLKKIPDFVRSALNRQETFVACNLCIDTAIF